jgi:hypothetical protein
MIPVTQFILGNSDPLLYPSEKMTNSIDEQIAFLQSQKQAINEAYRRIIGGGNISSGGRGGNIDNKVFESAITFWFKDVDFDGDKVWEYFHMNN